MIDVIVIGAGINGSWTGLHLAKQGLVTRIVEQFPLPHSRGSSHGQSRGIRKAYPEPFLTEMMTDAYDQWHQLEKDNNIKLMRKVGLLVMGPRDVPYFGKVVESLRCNSQENEIFAPHQMAEKFPSLSTGPNVWGCLDPMGGTIMADKALKIVWDAYRNFGGEIVDNAPVKKIEVESSDCVRVTLKSGATLESKSVVICAGPWTNKMLEPLGWTLPLKPIKIPVFYYRVKGPHMSHNFIYEDEDRHIWGLAELEYEGLVKICRHTGSKIDPDNRDVVDTTVDKAELRDFIAQNFPNVDPEPSIEESCIYTLSPDGVHILDQHPRYPNVVVGCGFSGSGFKLGPVTGEFLANLATGKSTKFSRAPFRASRFTESAGLQSFCLE